MSEKILLRIITPLGITLEKEVDFAVVPTVSGVVTIYPNHAPLVSVVHTGECISVLDGNRVGYVVFNGVLDVTHTDDKTEVTLLVDRSEKSLEIDITRAEEALKRAEDIKNGLAEEHVDFARFESLIDKEINRIKVGRRYK